MVTKAIKARSSRPFSPSFRRKIEELERSIKVIKSSVGQARVDYFDELTTKGYSYRGAYLMIMRKSGYL